MSTLLIEDRRPVRAARLRQILLGYLRALTPFDIPGVDGMTTDDVLREYPGLAARGLVPNALEIKAEDPGLADVLETVFHH